MNDPQLHQDITELKAEVKHQNASLLRIAEAMEKTLGDHEKRIRNLESTIWKLMGVIAAIQFIGFPATASLIVMFAK